MVSYSSGRSHWPNDIMEYLHQLRFYGHSKEANTKLLLVAKYIDEPETIKKLEDKWLYGTDHSRYDYNSPWNNWGF